MNIDITPIVQALITLFAAIVTSKLVPYIKAKASEQQQSLLMAVTKTFVFAAEQLYGAGKGSEKFEYVVKQLEEYGFTVDKNAIEAIVKQYATQLHIDKPVSNHSSLPDNDHDNSGL